MIALAGQYLATERPIDERRVNENQRQNEENAHQAEYRRGRRRGCSINGDGRRHGVGKDRNSQPQETEQEESNRGNERSKFSAPPERPIGEQSCGGGSQWNRPKQCEISRCEPSLRDGGGIRKESTNSRRPEKTARKRAL